MNMASWTKERTLDFIERYRANECLWRVKSKDYANKFKREKAYEDLINFIKTFYPNANKDTVVVKINNLRGSWRKENKKLISSQQSGAGLEERYEPSLFYFESLKFIGNSDVSTPGKESVFDSQDNTQSIKCEVDLPYHVSQDSQNQVEDSYSPDPSDVESNLDQNESLYAAPSNSRLSSTLFDVPQPAKKKRKTQEDDLLATDCERLKYSPVPDKFDTFGQTIAHNLREMSSLQYFHAQKLISEVLYEGNLGRLSRSSYLVSVDTDQKYTISYSNPNGASSSMPDA